MRLTTLFAITFAGVAPTISAQQFSVQDVERELISGSSKINSSLPFFLNRDVRLDSRFPGPGLRLTYVATVLNRSNGSPASVQELSPERVKAGICNDERRRVLLLNGVVFSYKYRREDLTPLTTLSRSRQGLRFQFIPLIRRL
jgi:hypothetical protein